MQDGLYFFGQWVADVDVVLNKQANDLTSPSTLQTTYANSFTLPDVTAIRVLLQNAEQLDSAGRDPYRLIPAKVIEEGEIIFSGTAALQSFQAGWKVLLAGPGRSLFDQLGDLKLSDLNLSNYDHPWTLESVARYVGSRDGILYPLIDNGSLDGGIFSQDTITPAIYATALIKTMLHQCGYRAVGNWLSDALLKRIFVPFVEEQPSAHDSDWVADRQARVTVPTSLDPIHLVSGHPINVLLPLSVDNQPVDGWQDGRLDCYKADRKVYVCPEAMKVKVVGVVSFISITRYGAAEIRLIVERNGVNAGEEYWSKAGYYDHLDYPDTITLETTVDCRKDDELRIRLTGNARTNIASYEFFFRQTPGDLYASFEPDNTIHEGDTWIVAHNMPDMSCADLLRSVALMCSATFNIDDNARTIELKTLNGVIANEANAADLSHCIEEGTEPENAVILQPYGQKNLLKWLALEDKTLAGYGDGVISCGAQNIPAEATLFDMPFSACIDSQSNVPGFGSPPLIETRTISGTGTNLRVTKKSTTPRLLLAEPSKPITVTVNAVTPELTVVPTQIQLTPCWWHKRPTPIALPENNFSLAFDRPSGNTSLEQTLIQRYFGGMKRVLRRPRQLTVSAYIRPYELATLDFYSPVRLRRVHAGSLDLNDGYYYLNKISNYRAGSLCSLVLIPY